MTAVAPSLLPPQVKATQRGRAEHHDNAETTEGEIRDYADCLAGFLNSKGHCDQPGTTWKLEIGPKRPSSNHRPDDARVVPRCIKDGGIDATIHPEGHDEARGCIIHPPDGVNVDKLFSELKNVSLLGSAEIAEMTASVGMDIAAMLEPYCDGKGHPLYRQRREKLDGLWANEETYEQLFRLLSQTVLGNFIDEGTLDKALHQIWDGPLDGLFTAFCRDRLVQAGYIRLTPGRSVTFELLPSAQQKIEAARLWLEAQLPKEVIELVGNLLSCETEQATLTQEQSHFRNLCREAEKEIAALETQLSTKRRKLADNQQRQQEISTKLGDPRLHGRLAALRQLREMVKVN